MSLTGTWRGETRLWTTSLAILAPLFALPVVAQTIVNATITDGDGQTWNNGHGFATFNPSPSGYKCASPIVSPTSFTMDGSGTFTVLLADNTQCTPVGSLWTFTLCSNTSAPCSNVTAMVFGGTQSLSNQLSAGVKPPRFAATSSTQSFGYLDSEVTPVPVPGGWYFNTTSIAARQWNGTAWQGFGGSGTANISHVLEMLSGDNAGNGIGMPEKGTTLVTGTPDTATVAWDEDVANGRFDCRNPAYAGGCLGSTPGLAMQAFANRLICYEAETGNHASTFFPPGSIAVGTAANPTLVMPAGANCAHSREASEKTIGCYVFASLGMVGMVGMVFGSSSCVCVYV